MDFWKKNNSESYYYTNLNSTDCFVIVACLSAEIDSFCYLTTKSICINKTVVSDIWEIKNDPACPFSIDIEYTSGSTGLNIFFTNNNIGDISVIGSKAVYIFKNT